MINIPLEWEQSSIISTISGDITASPLRFVGSNYIYLDLKRGPSLDFSNYKKFYNECRLSNESSLNLTGRDFTLISFAEWSDNGGGVLLRRNTKGEFPAGGSETWYVPGDGPKNSSSSSEAALRLRAPDFELPSASVTAPTDIRVRMSCTYRLYDDINGEAFKYEISGMMSASIKPKTKVLLDLPSSLSFGLMPAGGAGVRELPLTIHSDGVYSGILYYTADTHDGGINAKIGDGNLRLTYGTGHSAIGYADLSGKSGINISGTSGDKRLMHSVYLNAPTSVKLGTYRTNLRLRFQYF